MISTGQLAEQTAKEYLLQRGLLLVEQNFRCRLGEIDLIMQEGKEIIFVEVRYRKNNDFGGAINSITYQKQVKICKTAAYFLQVKQWEERFCRFDVVTLTSQLAQPEIQWIKHAFEAI